MNAYDLIVAELTNHADARRRGAGAPRLRHVCRLARLSAGFEQDDLATRMGTSRSMVSKVEVGLRGFTRTEAIAWADACGVDRVMLLVEVEMDAGSVSLLTNDPQGAR